MANKTATAKVTLTYTGPDNETVASPAINVVAQYREQLHAAAAVTDTLASGQDVVLDFGSVGVEASMLVVENRTKNGSNPGQPLTLSLNGGDIEVDLAIDGAAIFAYGGRAGNIGTPILSAKVTTTDVQAGDGLVSYHVFGDPVV